MRGVSLQGFERTWDEIETWRKRAALSRMMEISRREFQNGECLTEEESFAKVEKMLDEMDADGNSR